MKEQIRTKINWELIVKRIEKEANKEEKKLIETWLDENSEHQILYDEIHKVLKSRKKNGVSKAEKAFNLFLERNNLPTINPEIYYQKRKVTIRPFINFPSMAAAASILLLIVGGLVFFNKPISHKIASIQPKQEWQKITARNGQQISINLTDGSVVRLYAGSTLSFPAKFEGLNRQLHLDGEAYFDVVRDTLHPFIVQSGMLTTQVLGTSFKIEAFKDDDQASVIVVTGKVAVSTNIGKEKSKLLALVTPNEKIIFNGKTDIHTVALVSTSITNAISQGKLEFDNLSVEEMSKKIERYFNVNVHLEDTVIAKRHITATFDPIPLPRFVSVLQELSGLQISQKGSDIYISGSN